MKHSTLTRGRRMSETTELALPRVVPDAHCDSRAAALEEAKRRRAEVTGAVTQIRKSPYGGYVVISVPAKAVARAIRTTGGGIFVRGTYGYGEVYPNPR